MPDVENSLAEIDFALDQLRAAGFALMTNAHGHSLGDDILDSIFAKLDERKANLIIQDPFLLEPCWPSLSQPDTRLAPHHGHVSATLWK